MIVRVLEAHESECLAQTPLAKIDLEKATVAIAMNEAGETVGTMALVVLPHAEAGWVRKDYRNGTLFSRLDRCLMERARAFGIPKFYAFATDPQMEDYIARLGYQKKPWTVWEREA